MKEAPLTDAPAIPDTLQALTVPTDDLRPYHRNARRRAATALRESLTTHGQYRPLVVNRGTHTGRPNEILAGNGTWAEIRELGWPVVAVTWVDVDDDTAARIVLVDNRTNDLAGYDDVALLDLLQSLADDLTGTGWTPADLALLQPPEIPVGLTDVDDAPPLPPDDLPTITNEGELWLLGDHRLAVGDCTDPEVVARVLGNDPADMVFTDPPYGVSYVGKTADAMTIKNDALGEAALTDLLVAAFGEIHRNLTPGGAWYVCAPTGDLETTFRVALRKSGLALRQTIIWVKNVHVFGRSDYHRRHEPILTGTTDKTPPGDEPADDEVTVHEPILYGWRAGAAHQWFGGRKQNTVWEIAKPRAAQLHPTMKPVELVARAIGNNSTPGALILDLFGGSGSTMIAAHTTGRRSALIELDPRYADVIARRWQQHTGITPKLVKGDRAKPITFLGGDQP
jgi:DNA modification methylase